MAMHALKLEERDLPEGVCGEWYDLLRIHWSGHGYAQISADELSVLRARSPRSNVSDILPRSVRAAIERVMRCSGRMEGYSWLASADLSQADILFGEAEGYCWFRISVYFPAVP